MSNNAPPRPPSKFPLRLEQTTPRRVVAVQPSVPAPAPSASTLQAQQRQLLRPQAPLAHAALSARVAARPTGIGLDSIDVRRRMVGKLQRGGLTHPAVLAAFEAVPRHAFVDAALVTQAYEDTTGHHWALQAMYTRADQVEALLDYVFEQLQMDSFAIFAPDNQAYEDTSLPIGHGQTISKPSVVGRMIELLMDGANARAAGQAQSAQPLGRVLEIGTGCGYQAALLSLLSRSVMSVERLKPLHDKARENLAALRGGNLRLIYGDGMLGHPPNAPYDSIIAAAGGEALPEAWLAQLAIGGRLVAPVAQAGPGGTARQALMVLDRTPDGVRQQVLEAVLFVPLKSGVVR